MHKHCFNALINIFLLLLLLIKYNVDCAKILIIFPVPAPSHYILGSALAKGLAEKGHDITIISAFGEKVPPKNLKYRDIILTNFREEHKKRFEEKNFFDNENMNPIISQWFINEMGNKISDETLKHCNVQKLLKSNETFDVVIIEQFVNDALKAFAYHFKAHLVLFSTIGANSWINPLVANPSPLSYIPELNINFSDWNFFDRLTNVFMNIFNQLTRYQVFLPQQNKIMKKYFPNSPDLSQMIYNVSLVLMNSHVSTNQPVPLVPNMIDIGGYHVQPPKELPEYLKNFLDNAKNGVIYFSMGSNLQSKMLPPNKRDAFLKAFSKLNLKVLWKWENETLSGQPHNVKLDKWLPQQDILAHPNVKAFITHGGLLSMIEAVYHGVPLLALPIFGDQKLNANNIIKLGIGLHLPFSEITEENLLEKINEILNNSTYEKNIKMRSKLLHDRPVKPIDLADYWIQHVIRHNGGLHMRVAGVDLPWYQYLCIDVFIFILSILVINIYFIKLLFNKFFKAKQNMKLKSN